MNLVQVATLITRVRQDANLEGATGAIPDVEVMDRLNRAKAEFVDELRGSGGAGYFERRTGVLPTTPGVAIYQLPKDCISVQFVLAYLTATQYIRCTPFTDDMRSLFVTFIGNNWVFSEPIYYRLGDSGVNGDSIEFLPIPNGQFFYQVGYQYSPPDFILDATTNLPTGSIDDRNGWSDFLVARAAQGCCTKLKLYDVAGAMQAEAARQLDRIKRFAPMRDAGSAEVQRDVTRGAPQFFPIWGNDS